MDFQVAIGIVAVTGLNLSLLDDVSINVDANVNVKFTFHEFRASCSHIQCAKKSGCEWFKSVFLRGKGKNLCKYCSSSS